MCLGYPSPLLRTFSHAFSPAVSFSRLLSASITNTEVRPSQCCGSPYFPLIGLRFSRCSHLSTAAALFRPLHLAHDATRFPSLHSPPVEKACTWSRTAPSSSSSG